MLYQLSYSRLVPVDPTCWGLPEFGSVVVGRAGFEPTKS